MVRLRLWLGLGFRSRFGFFSSCWFLFLASLRLRILSGSRFCFFCGCWFGFFLLLSRLRFRLLLSGRFRFRRRCSRPRLRLLLLFRDPLVLWKVPVLHIRRHNLGALRVLVDLHHTERARPSRPRRDTPDIDLVQARLEMIRGQLPNSNPIRRPLLLMMNDQLRLPTMQETIHVLLDNLHTHAFNASFGASGTTAAPLTITLLI